MMMKNFFTSLRAIFAILLIGLIGPVTVQSQDAPNLIPYTLFHDFETGELFGWEPYPYQQDTGYDALFFTRQSPTYNNSNYAIARPVRANDTTELYKGFTRRLNMWTNEQTRLQAQIFLQADRNPEQLEVALGTFDGRLYSHVIESPQTNRWVELDLAVGDFRDEQGRSLQPGEHIQVVKLEANYPIVYYLFTYTILMDDFQLNGDRQRRFVAESPVSTDLEEFDQSILHRHYHAGDVMSLRVNPEGNIALDGVRGRLLDSSGRVVRDNIAFDRRAGAWVNDSIRRFQSSDARGQWTIELTGQRSGHADVEWAFDFLVPVQQVSGHPRLFFTSESLAERKRELENHPVASRILENALSNREFMDVNVEAVEEGIDLTSESLTGGPYGKYFHGFGAPGLWRTPMVQLGNVVRDGSFNYAFTGDSVAGEQAKAALLKLCSFKKWNSSWMLNNQFWVYYPIGYTLKDVAYGYDLLHDLMTEEERAFVREAIIEKGLKLFHRDMVEMNRMPSNNTNHLAVLATGHGLAALVMYGEEDPDHPYMEPFLSGIMAKAETFIGRAYFEDGSYAEPFTYQAMASRSLVELMAALELNIGVDWSTNTPVKDFYAYPMYASHTDRVYEHPGSTIFDLEASHTGGAMPDYGDAGRTYDGFAQTHAWWFIHRLGNPYLYHFVKPYWEEGFGGYLSWLWYRDDLEPETRDQWPTSRVFDLNGIVMRSDWEDEGTIITKRVGPHANHFHFDQGSFQILTNGEFLLDDPGVGANGYYANLPFVVYNIHAVAHNVMLVDNDAESQKPAHFDTGIAALIDWPVMSHTFTGEIADAVESDLTTVYKDKLSKYSRTLLYTKYGPIFLFDQVESVSPYGHTFNWLFHTGMNGEERSMRVLDDQRILIDRPKARLTMNVISPLIASSLIRETVAAGRGGIPFYENFVTLNSEESLSKVNFLAVLYPEARPSNGNYGQRPTTERVQANGWLGARVTHPGGVDYGMFRTCSSAALSVAGFTTDATRFTASLDESGNLVRYYLEGTSFEGHDHWMRAGSPVTLAVLHHQDGTDAEVYASGSARVSFSVQSRPSRVSMGGSSVHYNYENGRVSVQVPAGRHNIEFR